MLGGERGARVAPRLGGSRAQGSTGSGGWGTKEPKCPVESGFLNFASPSRQPQTPVFTVTQPPPLLPDPISQQDCVFIRVRPPQRALALQPLQTDSPKRHHPARTPCYLSTFLRCPCTQISRPTPCLCPSIGRTHLLPPAGGPARPLQVTTGSLSLWCPLSSQPALLTPVLTCDLALSLSPVCMSLPSPVRGGGNSPKREDTVLLCPHWVVKSVNSRDKVSRPL